MSTSNDDCFYFYTSTCTKGDKCAYRHCEAARQSTVTCVFWKQNKCKSTECPYRHSETIKPIMQNKAELPCYFETIASGCTRPSCPFKHLKPRPQKVLKASSSSTNIITLVDATQDDGTSQPTPGTLAEADSLEGPVIDPIIVNPAEDSDFDSPFNSPVKNVVKKSGSVSNVIDVTSRKDLTFQETGKKNDPPAADSGNEIVSLSSHQLSGKVSPQLKRAPSEIEPTKVISSSHPSETVSQVKKTSPTTKNIKVRKLSVKKGGTGTRPSTAPTTKQPDKQLGTPQQNRARKALATAKERSKHAAAHSARSPEEAKQPTVVKKGSAPTSVEPKVISLKKKSQEKTEEVKTTDEENSDEDLGIKSLEQTLRERALRSMGIIELKSGRIVRTKDQPVKKEEPIKQRKRSSSDDRSKKDRLERNSSDKLPVHKRIGTEKRTPPDRKRSVEERNSQARNKEREERIRRLKLEQERENKRRQIMAAKRKARAQKALEAVVVKKEESDKESASQEEDSEEEEAGASDGEESSSEGGNEEVKDEEEELGEEVDIELGEGEPEEEEEEVPVKIVFDTRRAIRKSDSMENFTIKKSVPVEPVKAKVTKEVTIKKTFVVQHKEENEKPKRKRRVILEDDDPAPVPAFSNRSNIRKPIEMKTKVEEVKKPKIEKKLEDKQLEPVVKPVVKPVVSAPKVKATNVWSRRAWDSKPKESGDSTDSRPSLGTIRSRLGLPEPLSVGSSGDQETKSKETEPKLRRRLGWRKTPIVSADDDTDSDSSTTVKKAVSLAAIRARVGQKPATGSDEGSTSIPADSRDDMSAANKKYRQPIQIYVPPAKKRPSVPDDEEPSKKRFTVRDMEGLKEEIKPKEVKTFVQIMAEKRERQKKLVEEQKNTSSLDSCPNKKTYAPVKFAINETDLSDDSTKSRLTGESPLSVSVSNSVSSSSSPSSGHLPTSSSYSDSMVTSSSSQHWSLKEQTKNLISSQFSHDTPTDKDSLGVSDIENHLSEKILPQTSTNKAAPTISVPDISSTQDLSEDSPVGLLEKRDQICVEAFPLQSNKMESVKTITSDVQREEKVLPAKRSSHNDSWLDIDIGDLDPEMSEEETNDDDLLREIDELLA